MLSAKCLFLSSGRSRLYRALLFFILRSLCGVSGAHILLRRKLLHAGKKNLGWFSVEKGPYCAEVLKWAKYLFYQTLWLTPLSDMAWSFVMWASSLLWRSSRQNHSGALSGCQNRQESCRTLPFFNGQSFGHLLFKVKHPQPTWLTERKETMVPSQSG